MLKDSILILKDSIKNRDISFIILCFSLLILPLSINLSSICFVVSLITKLLSVLIKKQKLFHNEALKNSALIGALFFMYIIASSLIQSGAESTIKFFESEYSKFALLFIAPLLLSNKRQNKILLYSIMLSTFLAILIAALFSITQQMTFGADIFLQLFDIHHTYLALFILTSINWLVLELSKKETRLLFKASILVLIFTYSYVLYAIESKVSVLILCLLIVYYFFWGTRSKKLLKITSLVLIIGFLALFNAKLKVGYENALDFRLQLWDAAVTSIKDNPILGNTAYPEKMVLNYQHYLSGKYYFLDSNLNTHNQYLSLILRFGILGFLLFMSTFVLVAKRITFKKIDNKINEAIGFIFIILSVFYTENILDRHHGIVWFTIFLNYYLVSISDE